MTRAGADQRGGAADLGGLVGKLGTRQFELVADQLGELRERVADEVRYRTITW